MPSRGSIRTSRVLIIEHDMDVVFRFAERITVLVAGAVLIEGAPEEIRPTRACARSISAKTMEARRD